MPRRPPTRAERRDATRSRLLDAARASFEREGFDGTHLRDVAAAAGVATGTVFVHFADKRDLLHACLFEDLEAALATALATGPKRLEPWLAHLAGALFDAYAARPTLSRVLLKESLLADPPWAERFQGQVARVHAAVAERFAKAQAKGQVAGDPQRFALAFVSFYTFALLASVQGAHPDPRGLVARLVADHLHGARP